MTPIPGALVRSPAALSRPPRLLAYLRQGAVTPQDCPCPLEAECRKLRGPVACEGDGVMVIGREKVTVRL